jgi:hypothetical protein
MKDMKAQRPLNPLADYFVRTLFGTEENKDLLKDFINSVFHQSGTPEVVELTLLSAFNLKSRREAKETGRDVTGVSFIGPRTTTAS